jgi:ComF family protein
MFEFTGGDRSRAVRRMMGLGGSCLLCHRWSAEGLCEPCVACFAPPRPRCAVCAHPVAAIGTPCAECLRHPPAWDAAVAAVDYAFPWDGVLLGLKSSAGLAAAAPLAALLARAIAGGTSTSTSAMVADVVLPIPLAPQRLRERGFNQAWEIARRVAAEIDRPCEPQWLWRVAETPLLADLSPTQRAQALRAAFVVSPSAVLQGRHVALVDDVLTTGATLAAAARTLRQQGAAAVSVWVVARTEAPSAEVA